MNSITQTTPDRRLFLMRLAWTAWVAALIPYTVVFVTWFRAGRPISSSATLRLALWGIALYEVWASFRWRRSIAELNTAISTQESTPNAAVDLLRRRGLILGVLSHSAYDYLPLAASALLLLYIHRPWSQPFERALQTISEGSAYGNRA